MRESNLSEVVDLTQRYLSQLKELGEEEIFLNRDLIASLSHLRPESASDLSKFYRQIKDCQLCPLSRTRTNLVFGVGNPAAGMVLVGEAPGRDEDLQGEPFVGRAGQLLNKILKAIDFERADVYICNILKCRPPGNRDPLPDEIEACKPYLLRQLEMIKPQVILVLGRVAAQVLLKTSSDLGKLRGRIHLFGNSKLVVTYHPAALLRNPRLKRPAWEDVQLARRVYDGMEPEGADDEEISLFRPHKNI
ncbi:uracil-DNA glycosylase [candidate division KSB1 bacterium]|nr:uracil-DNA glycosylase [candidate division KSB1 bacterium]